MPQEQTEATEQTATGPAVAAPWDAWTVPPTFAEPPESPEPPEPAAPFPQPRPAAESAPEPGSAPEVPEPTLAGGEAGPASERAAGEGWGAGRPGSGEAWGKTAFAEGDVRWAPELPPGWVAADEEEVAEPGVVGGGPPTYAAEPTAWPEADPDDLGALVADTVVDGAHYGSMTLRSVSVRGDSARFRGQPRRDALLTARFGTGDEALLLVAMASGARASDDAHRAAQDAVRWIAGAVGRSRNRLSDDLRAARRGSLKSGLHRLTDRCYGRLRARGEDLGLDEGTYTASLRCLLLPVDPECRIRLFFGVGDGGLFRIRDGQWQDLDLAPDETAAPFRFRASVAQPGDGLVMCSGGLAEPLRGEPALATHLAARWGDGPPGMAAYLADAQTRVKGYADDRTAVTVWEA
ncbi:protein phosphatase 2C domain-containing protein [Streptomyces sp. NPDC051976]|uniref:protein phosphatase 2C domain-containing protein n=1 Tax=Streptomyces sp. NPDC051976 TaxID=3154947 RepID=UPI003426947E